MNDEFAGTDDTLDVEKGDTVKAVIVYENLLNNGGFENYSATTDVTFATTTVGGTDSGAVTIIDGLSKKYTYYTNPRRRCSCSDGCG